MNSLSSTAQLPILPVVIPLLTGALLVLLRRRAGAAGLIASAALLAQLACAAALCAVTADGTVLAYLAGNWPAPFGIAFAVDRLGAAMLLVTAIVAIASQIAAADGLAQRRPSFFALLQFQLAGLNGAFLTADLFNLFVFFELLLVASFALLLVADGRGAVRAGLHYVVVNLFGSALFLMAAALLYGVLGTLNMADLAQRVASVAPADRALVEAAGLMLLVAFGIKAAALPLGFWLPATYGAAAAPVAALFALLTKVGIYAILRVGTLVYGGGDAPGYGPLLVAVGLATLGCAAFVGLAARDLRSLAAWMIAGSAGTLLMLLGVGTPASLGAALFYLPHASFAAAALMLVAGLLAAGRGRARADHFEAGARPAGAVRLGTVFVVCGIASAGLPPFSGFVAEAILLDSVATAPAAVAIWAVVLAASLAWVVALARGGSVVFWKSATGSPDAPPDARPGTWTAVVGLAVAGALLVVFAAPLHAHFARAGAQLVAPTDYRAAVLGQRPVQRLAPRGSHPASSGVIETRR